MLIMKKFLNVIPFVCFLNKMIIRIKEIYFKYLQNTTNMKVEFVFKNHIDCELKCIIAYDYY